MPVDTRPCRCGRLLGQCDNLAVASVEQQWDALLPIKPTHDVKSRLLPDDRQTRLQLVPAFVADTIAALIGSSCVARIAVVGGRWPLASEVANPIMWIPEPGSDSALGAPTSRLNVALLHAVRALRESARRPIIIVAADLPALRAASVSLILREAGSGGACSTSFVRDASGTGTTMLLTPVDEAPDPHFGPNSASRHAQTGAVDISALADVGARCDVDTVTDLRQALATGVGSHSALAIARSTFRGFAARNGASGHDEAGQPGLD